MQYLNIEENIIKTINPFPDNLVLSALLLGQNSIREITDFDNLLLLPNLLHLSMYGNPPTKKNNFRNQILIKFPNLITLDYREVTIEEKERINAYFMPLNTEPVIANTTVNNKYILPNVVPQRVVHLIIKNRPMLIASWLLNTGI